jgi:dTMP kinase
MRNGFFISFEGIEGTGKSTQAKLLREFLVRKGYNVILTEEPGGTQIGERLRDLLLSVEFKEIHAATELLLYNASRAQHIHDVILPALNRGTFVITDRFVDSTVAYQAFGRGLDADNVSIIERITTVGLKPDITFLLDLDVETGLTRNKKIHKKDRFELETLEFHQRVREGYLQIAAKAPERIRLIDASENLEKIHKEITHTILDVISNYGSQRYHRTR